MIRVLCVDDNRLMADALERRLRDEPGIEWAGWVENAAQAVDAVRRSKPTVVLLDIDMPGHDCFELVGEIGQANPDTRVIMFSGHVRADYLERAIDAGAWGYVSKNDRISDLLDSMRRAVADEFAITPDVASECDAKT